ncbi:MAG: PKD domain-containing protein [Candidatus Bipolaricaulota bacterium]|nr:MAG: PKD domain-containing protein [Candidatus Bipolaricaulota bacterium]
MIRRLACLLLLVPLALAGCSLTSVLDQFTNEPPVAAVEASPTSGPCPLEVTFDGRGSWDDNGIIAYQWDFGDPHSIEMQYGPMASHTYTLPGTYNAKLVVVDEEGEIGVKHVPIVVEDPLPVANFTTSNELPPAGAVVAFDAGDSYDPAGGELLYSWEFGDGATAVGETVSHLYETPGYYVVTLTVTDKAGGSCSTDCQLIVQDGGGTGASTCGPGGSCGSNTGHVPLAVISGLDTPGDCEWCVVYVNETLTLDGSYSRAADGRIVRYSWDFGDGETAEGPVVQHAYTEPGQFTLKFTVTDDKGQQTTREYYVTVKFRSP